MSTSNFTMSMNSSVNSSDLDPSQVRDILYRMDDEFAFTILVAIIYLSVLMVVGFLGNLMVCVVYTRKFKVSTTRVFVLALAGLDLTSCCLAMPGEILDMRRNFSYDNVVMCKVARMANTFCSISSGVVLIAVAVDRYKKICNPLNIQITPHGAKMAVLYSLLASMLISWPAAVLYGERSVETTVPGVVGTDCSTADIFVKTPFPLVYNAVLFLIFFGSTVTLITLYCFIWRQVKQQCKFRNSVSQSQSCARLKKMSSSSGSGHTGSTDVSHDGSPSHGDHHDQVFTVSHQPGGGDVIPLTLSSPEGKALDGRPSGLASDRAQHEPSPLCEGEEGKYNGKTADSRLASKSSLVRKSSSILCRKKREVRKKMSTSNQKDSATRKTTFMLFLITLCFILSYLPHLALMAARAVNTTMMDELQGAAMAAYNLFLRSYFLQSAVNPLIYSFCNVQFRTECKNLFTGVFFSCKKGLCRR